MTELVYLVPLLPLLGFITLLVAGRRLGEPMAGWLATAAIGGSFLAAVGTWVGLIGLDEHDRRVTHTVFEWVPVGDFSVDVGFLVDPLSVAMILFVTGIGTLIHLYSIGYMHGDANFSKFFLYLNLFAFSMLMLVLGDNLLLTFLGWEGVGACSYFLISFWFEEEANATAGKKAFVTNRVGDWGFMVATFLAFATIGSINYLDIDAAVADHAVSGSVATGLALLIFVGAMGKSAQFPLYLWLPDAMAGPTPVSALIHAATMVTSGVYLLTRINSVLHDAGWANDVIAWVGVGTALFAATIAVAQNDIKKVLAYSTVSQLGYMFLAVGTGAYVAAIFHMVTHAFFKALLFLGSGSVIHGMHDEQDMRKMGKLFKFMPVTASTFIVGWLAIAGVPPFAGFWSKDEILLFALAESPILYVIGIVTAILTAFYMTRQVVMTFFGEQKWGSHANEAEAAHLDEAVDEDDAEADAPEPVETHGAHGEFKPHESPPFMLLPLVVLAGLSIVGGIIQLPSLGIIPKSAQHKLLDWLHPIVEFEGSPVEGIGEAHIDGTWAYDNKVLLIFVAIACALVGIAAGIAVYQRKMAKAIEPELLARGWGYDDAISWFMGKPGRDTFQAVADGDAKIVDGAVNGVAVAVRETAEQVRKGQTGYVRQYAGVIGIGVVLLLGWFVVIRGIL